MPWAIYTWVHLHNKGSRGKGLNYNCTTADLVKITTSGSQYRHSHAFTGFRSGRPLPTPASCSGPVTPQWKSHHPISSQSVTQAKPELARAHQGSPECLAATPTAVWNRPLPPPHTSRFQLCRVFLALKHCFQGWSRWSQCPLPAHTALRFPTYLSFSHT